MKKNLCLFFALISFNAQAMFEGMTIPTPQGQARPVEMKNLAKRHDDLREALLQTMYDQPIEDSESECPADDHRERFEHMDQVFQRINKS